MDYLNEGLNEFTMWIANNSKEFKERYPELYKGIKETINNDIPDFMLENVIQILPSTLLENLKQIDDIPINHLKETKINELIEIINVTLNKEFTNTSIERQRQKIIPELLEIKQYLQQKRSDMMQRFDCPLSIETVKAVYKDMAERGYIEADLSDFLKVFNKEQGSIKKPVKWLIKHGTKPNKTALFNFLNIMLCPNGKEFQRNYFKIANKVFAPTRIFEQFRYPKVQELKSNSAKYFIPIKTIIENTRPQQK